MCSKCNDKSIFSNELCQKCWDSAHGIVGRIAYKSKIRPLYQCIHCGLSTLRIDRICQRIECIKTRPLVVCKKCKKLTQCIYNSTCQNCINSSKNIHYIYSPIEDTPESIIAYFVARIDEHNKGEVI